MKYLLLSVLVVGCGGSDFTPQLFAQGGYGNGGETQTSTGGEETSTGGIGVSVEGGSGGAHAADDGGLGGGSTGGSGEETGGTQATGDAATTSTGGTTAVATGGSPATGGSLATGGASSCLVTHSTGLGQTWEDCTTVGTHDATEAAKACETWCAASGCTGSCTQLSLSSGTYIAEQEPTSNGSIVTAWGYYGTNTGNVFRIVYNPSPNAGAVVGTWN